MLEDAEYQVIETDSSLGLFADFSGRKQTSAELAIIDGQAGVADRKEIIDALTTVRRNLPHLRLIIIFPSNMEKDHPFISRLLTLSIYDMYFRDGYSIEELGVWIANPKSYGNYDKYLEAKDIKGGVEGVSVPQKNKVERKAEVVEEKVEPIKSKEHTPRSQIEDTPAKNNRVAEAHRQPIQIIQPREYKTFATKIVTITGTKGGMGRTDIAINLAAGMKKHIGDAKVCLLDFDFPYGGVAPALGFRPDTHLGDWLKGETMVTEKGVESRVCTRNGIDVIPMATRVREALEFKKDHAEYVLDVLRKYYDVIIIDVSGFSDPSLAALEMASEVVCVCNHDIASISVTNAYIGDLINLHGINPGKMSLFLNMVPLKEDISRTQIAEVFEDVEDEADAITVVGYAPHDDLIRQYRNKHRIIYDEMPDHSFCDGINMLMRSMGVEPNVKAIGNIKGKGGLLSVFQKNGS